MKKLLLAASMLVALMLSGCDFSGNATFASGQEGGAVTALPSSSRPAPSPTASHAPSPSPTRSPAPSVSPSPSPSPASSPSNVPNVLTVTVGGTSLCGTNANIPCVSLKICVPGTQSCVTVSDLLVDTGSVGLRVFKQALGGLALPQVRDSSNNAVAECATFGIGNDWGPVMSASVTLAGEAAVTIPIQVIDATFVGESANCAGSDTDPQTAGLNGILGVGLFVEDCGDVCAVPISASNPTNGMYFSCGASSCSPLAMATNRQVLNPVGALATDNNGVILRIPSVAASGASSVTGSLTLGIGTQADNHAGSVSTYAVNANGAFTVNFASKSYASSFIDSGSNGVFFPGTSQTTACTTDTGFYCPASALALSATDFSSGGAVSGSVSFEIDNAETLFNSGNRVFSTLGGADSAEFDWGFPFFTGRTVYVGITGRSSPLGTGPYWSF